MKKKKERKRYVEYCRKSNMSECAASLWLMETIKQSFYQNFSLSKIQSALTKRGMIERRRRTLIGEKKK